MANRLRDVFAVTATCATLLVMIGGYGWRGEPPSAVEFLILIAIAAVGFGLGYGSFRDAQSGNYVGVFCVVVCGWFLGRALVGLLQGSLQGFAW
jgi:hypothetical protein